MEEEFILRLMWVYECDPLHQPFTKDHHITLQSIKSEAITMLKVVILAMCFETDITFVISELKAKASLREFTGVHDVPDAKEVYRLLSRFTVDQFVDMVLRIVNAVCGKRKRGKTIIIGDTTNLTVDLDWFRKKYQRGDLKDKDYKWAYSKSKGYYIGMKTCFSH